MTRDVASVGGTASRGPRGVAFAIAILRNALLVSLAAAGLSACIAVPIPQNHDQGRVVKADPLTIKVGATTEEDILLRLGDPDMILADKRVFVYEWDHIAWAVLWLIPFGPGAGGVGEIPNHEMLLIRFDESGLAKQVDRTEMPRDVALPDFLRTWAERGETNAKP